jgi:hypothetical protein
MGSLAYMLRDGEGCEKDWRQAVIWGAKDDSNRYVFWELLRSTSRYLEIGKTAVLDCDFNQLCYSIGWGLYWYQYYDTKEVFVNRCLDYYCSCIELQQKSIFTFLLCWNRTTGVYDAGFLIAHMVWEGREENLVQTFDQMGGEEPETKRIKK